MKSNQCPDCGTSIDDMAGFCPECGLAIAPIAQPSAQRPVAPNTNESADRASWFSWLVYGGTPEQRLARKRAKNLASSLQSVAQQLGQARGQSEAAIAKAVADVRRQRTKNTLRELPLDRLKEFFK